MDAAAVISGARRAKTFSMVFLIYEYSYMADVFIRALEPGDYEITYQWRLHEPTWDSVVGPKRFVSKETEKRWVEQAIQKHERGEILRFAICEKETEEMLGLLSVTEIDNHNRSFRTGSIVSPVSRGKGLIGKGRELVFRYMFDEIGMERVWAIVLDDNISNQGALEKFGYIKEGVMRRAAFKKGKYRDLFVYSMLKEEFHEKYGSPAN